MEQFRVDLAKIYAADLDFMNWIQGGWVIAKGRVRYK